MTSSDLNNKQAYSFLSGGSMSYIEALYEDYLKNPQNVDPEWRDTFDKLPAINTSTPEVAHSEIKDYFLQHNSNTNTVVTSNAKQAAVTDLINAYRTHGHQEAKLDPLQQDPRPAISALELKYHNLEVADLSQVFNTDATFSKNKQSLSDIVTELRETYCGSIGIEYMHIVNSEEIDWIQQYLEPLRSKPRFSDAEKRQILQDLIAADGLEKYLHTRYVGQKRFSLEGGDSLVPMIKDIISRGATIGVKEIVIGMAHRGRLNVLVNVLGKEPNELFDEFEGKHRDETRTGDVKYHMGFSSDIQTDSQAIVHVALGFNPSHLEIIGPVIEGSARSRLRRRHDLEKKNAVVPVVIHGDAAFAGQGVVMETLNFSQARGYCTGGTVHIVINNQIGFTTSNPLDARSTLYCTDVAKMVQAPVIHVNGDDPEAVVFITQLALDFRMRFKRDVVIDLVCYRRHGHNEADEPSVTQPLMYQKIKQIKPVREIYAQHLIDTKVVTSEEVDRWIIEYRDNLDNGRAVVATVKGAYQGKVAVDWEPYIKAKWTDVVDTTVSLETIQKLSNLLLNIPEGFNVHPVVKRLLDEREKMTLGELPINWGYAETMAYATLLQQGYGVRLSGQDSGRGTFAHRHAVLHDQVNGEIYVPLDTTVSNPEKGFAVIDSVLSEAAVLAFEYGYSASEPTSLVLWEAQFGDFANGAQVVIDQFISSGEQKWGRLCGLVLLLPHGYEGQGPEHSSARLERFMQLCAQTNMQVCNPTTPAQIFHLLRRQQIRLFRKPLIIMTPKSLLRHKLAVSTMGDLTDGKFYTVLPEVDVLQPEQVTKVVLCCGKVYYDLLQRRRELQLQNIAIVRIEQLYPFPKKALKQELNKYPFAKQVVWCQEEPQNQGVWFSSKHNIKDCLEPKVTLLYSGRGFAAAPATGNPQLHAQQQKDLVDNALGNSTEIPVDL